MQIVDTGVLTPSFMDFSLPSEFAKSALYYCPQFGQFICNSDYRIERNGIDQYQWFALHPHRRYDRRGA